MKTLNRLEELIIFILDRADKGGIKDLSDFQFMKILYLLEVFSLKYAGMRFVNETFARYDNGPITTSFYSARDGLILKNYIDKDKTPNPVYGHDRTSNKLGKKKITKFVFTVGETIFLDNFLSDLLPLTQIELKRMAYETEPMKEILNKEGDTIKKGTIIDFNKIIVDADVLETYSDEV